MPTVLQFRRGTTAQNGNFTGTLGELSVNTTTDAIRVHDGSTAGGFEMMRADLSNGADAMQTSSSTASKPEIKLTNTADDATSPLLIFESDRANPADNDVAGEISFIASDSGGTQTEFAQIQGIAADVTNTTEDGKLTFTTLVNGSAVVPLTLDASGATIVGNVAISNGGTIGTASDADSITIASAGAVTFSQRSVHSAGITIADAGQIGSASDADAIAIASDGVVTFSQTIAGSINGTANIGTNVTVSANNSTNETCYPTFVDGATGTQGIETDTGLTYNPSNGTLTTTILAGTANAAKYADLAEMYTPDQPIEPGTVVCFGGKEEITVCDIDMCQRVAGVISTDPAYLMNSDLDAGAPLALAGRTPCKVTGSIKKGDMMVSAGNGRARAEANPVLGSIIGKAVEDSEGDAIIEVVIGRL